MKGEEERREETAANSKRRRNAVLIFGEDLPRVGHAEYRAVLREEKEKERRGKSKKEKEREREERESPRGNTTPGLGLGPECPNEAECTLYRELNAFYLSLPCRPGDTCSCMYHYSAVSLYSTLYFIRNIKILVLLCAA